MRGELHHQALDLSEQIDSPYQSLFLFPHEDAIELSSEFIKQFKKPIQLIVPDGNWRQASKVFNRQPELKNIPRVKISAANLATNHLRAEHMTEGMSTLEAIAKAFGFIEGAEVETALMKLYLAKLKNTLAGRGLAL